MAIYTFLTSSYAMGVYRFGNKSLHAGATVPMIPVEYYIPIETFAANTWDMLSHNNALANGWINQLEYDETIALIPLPIPPTPILSVDDAGNFVVGIDETMEYVIDGALIYTTYDPLAIPVLSGQHTIKVRIKKVPMVTAPSLDVLLTFTTDPVKPLPPTVYMDDVEDIVVGIDTTMEYSHNGVDYIAFEEEVPIGLNGYMTIYVRVSAEGINPPSDVVILPFTYNPIKPDAPVLSLGGTANTVTGMTTLMEFSIDSSEYTNYVPFIFNMIDFNGEYVFKARVKAKGDNPYSDSTVLNLVTNIV